jgi:hypothetical protein
MKNNLLLTGFFCFLFTWSFAQQENWPAPCGTPPGKTAWLKKYQQNPQAHFRNNDTLLYVPITVHLVGSDAGTGHFNLSRLADAFCKLNEDYEEANIQFYMEGAPNYISNSEWFNHETVLIGAEMMFANNVENTINTYFTTNPAGNCGYNLPYAGIAMSHSCSGANDDTWAHEVGHNLSVQHPFLGWEGGVSHDGSVDHNYLEPAPATVTYDYTYFKDTLIVDTLIIDTAQVELVDGSNCFEAADGFCDTAPDYLGGRWFCNGEGESPQLQTDPNGETFRSDGTLIMGYADDPCQSRFTPEQIAAMRANLYEEKADYLYNQEPGPVLGEELPLPISPVQEELAAYNNVFLEWEAVENASYYVIQLSPLPTYGGLTKEYTTSGPTLNVTDELIEDRVYYWRVKAFNNYDFCSTFTESETFTTSIASNVNNLSFLKDIQIYPNPARQMQDIRVQLVSSRSGNAFLSLKNSTGISIETRAIDIQSGQNRYTVDTDQLPQGLYFIELSTERGERISRKVVIY